MDVLLESIERAFCLQLILDEVPARSSSGCSPGVAVGALSRALPLVPPAQSSWRQELPGDVDGSVFLFGLAHFPRSIFPASPTVSHPTGTKQCHSLLLCWGNLQAGAFPSIGATEGLF